jgi:hypothetical protein
VFANGRWFAVCGRCRNCYARVTFRSTGLSETRNFMRRTANRIKTLRVPRLSAWCLSCFRTAITYQHIMTTITINLQPFIDALATALAKALAQPQSAQTVPVSTEPGQGWGSAYAAARLAGVSHMTIRREAAANRLRHRRVRNRLMIWLPDLATPQAVEPPPTPIPRKRGRPPSRVPHP